MPARPEASVAGLVLAAGASRRPGRPKQLAGRGDSPLAVCRYSDGIGHPFAFAGGTFPALAALHGDKGVWRLLDALGRTR